MRDGGKIREIAMGAEEMLARSIIGWIRKKRLMGSITKIDPSFEYAIRKRRESDEAV
jgi:hypothetical protein